MMIRQVSVNRVKETVRDLLIELAYRLPADYPAALRAARAQASSPLGGDILTMLLDNTAYAESERIPTCQDTGKAFRLVQPSQEGCDDVLTLPLPSHRDKCRRRSDQRTLQRAIFPEISPPGSPCRGFVNPRTESSRRPPSRHCYEGPIRERWRCVTSHWLLCWQIRGCAAKSW